MNRLIIFLFVTLLFVGCKKNISDEVLTSNQDCAELVIDTLTPLSYYPVFPGSYWKYLENDSDTITKNASLNYIQHNYLTFFDGSDTTLNHYSDTVYVPFLDNEPIYQYNKIEYFPPPFGGYYGKWPILSEELGFQFNRDWTDTRFGDFNEKVVVTEKTINANLDSVIFLKGNWVYGPNINNVSYQIYEKNVGLTSHIIIDTVSTDTIYKLKLIDYFIN